MKALLVVLFCCLPICLFAQEPTDVQIGLYEKSATRAQDVDIAQIELYYMRDCAEDIPMECSTALISVVSAGCSVNCNCGAEAFVEAIVLDEVVQDAYWKALSKYNILLPTEAEFDVIQNNQRLGLEYWRTGHFTEGCQYFTLVVNATTDLPEDCFEVYGDFQGALMDVDNLRAACEHAIAVHNENPNEGMGE